MSENNEYIGECPDEICNRNGCIGTIVRITEHDSCSCHISAPCPYCCCAVACDECDFETDQP